MKPDLRRRCGCLLSFILVATSFDSTPVVAAGKLNLAVEKAKEFLDSDDDGQRSELANKLGKYDDQLDSIIERLQQREYTPVEPGYYPDEDFTAPRLAKSRADELLYILVPKSYEPDRPTGLVMFMHGGGRSTGPRAPRHTIRFPDEDDEDDDGAMGDLFDRMGLIAVGPSALTDGRSAYRWCLEESDEYLADVIEECESRFNIDRNRIFLLGHSMGGFGAFHHAQRQPDRFAAVISSSGSWRLAHWPTIHGTRLCFINGVHDAVKNERWHYTDIAYARWTDKLLRRQKLDYVYFEHDGGHDISCSKPFVTKFLEGNRDLRRDPYHPHVVLTTPVGYSRYYSSDVKHNRWMTLDETKAGTIEFDELRSDENVDFDDWELRHERYEREGASLEAHNLAGNLIEVSTQNVVRFTIWLHPKMIDIARPVRVIVDGNTQFEGTVRSSLATALESYERRHDWQLIYPMKIVINLSDDTEDQPRAESDK